MRNIVKTSLIQLSNVLEDMEKRYEKERQKFDECMKPAVQVSEEWIQFDIGRDVYFDNNNSRIQIMQNDLSSMQHFASLYSSGNVKMAELYALRMDTALRDNIPLVVTELMGFKILDKNKAVLSSNLDREQLSEHVSLIIKAYQENNPGVETLEKGFAQKFSHENDYSMRSVLEKLKQRQNQDEQQPVSPTVSEKFKPKKFNI